MFLIEFVGKPYETRYFNKKKYVKGLLVMDGDTTSFYSPVSYWKPKDYIRQWQEACERIIVKKRKTSALITNMLNPALKHSQMVWNPMYALGNYVYIQEQVVPFDHLSVPFDEKNPYKHLPRRGQDENPKPSEWAVDIDDLKAFYLSMVDSTSKCN